MFSIPYTFSNEDESYITIPVLKRFAKEKKNEDLKTTVDRPQLIQDIDEGKIESIEIIKASLATKNQIKISKKASTAPIKLFPLIIMFCRKVDIVTSKIRAKKIFTQTNNKSILNPSLLVCKNNLI